MKILLIGRGGREHALAWKLRQSPKVEQVFVAPGNAGIAKEINTETLSLATFEELVEFCHKEDIAFTLVGPEVPLSRGIVNYWRDAGLPIFGPTKEAAQLESSKDFAKAFMMRHNIPTAKYQTFTDAQAAHDYVNQQGVPIVIKADGLAAGKGVVVAESLEQAHAAIDAMLIDNAMGDAGARVVIEDFLQGEEASFIVMVDGENVLPLASSQDHKRLLNDDKGPNTGGMGAYSPAPIVTPEVHQRVMDEIILPTIKGMKEEGNPFTGFLYAGLMIDANGAPFVVEFNCRMGDPETQPIMMRLQSDFPSLIEAALSGSLNTVSVEWDLRPAVGVVMAAEGYPNEVRKGDAIHGVEEAHDFGKIFYAGVKSTLGHFVTNGGRVLCAVALGNTIAEAKENAYKVVEPIHFDGMHFRTDIADKALSRKA